LRNRDSFIVPLDEQTGKPTGTPSLVDPNYNSGYPEWSPDGKLLYYQTSKGSPSEELLFIRSEVTGQIREINLKPKLLTWYRPILSPDGQQFAITGTNENMNFGIFAIDSKSGDVSQLARIPVENNPVDPCQNWSPDGKAIFFNVRSPEEREEFIIRRKDLTTGEEKDVYRGMHTRGMKISSDGNRFVYYRNDMPNKSYVVGILDIQSGKELELWRVPEANGTDISEPIWAPDKRHVLVGWNLKQGTELWRFPVTGGPGEKLHFFPEEYYFDFVMHPNGKQLAFTQYRVNDELWVLENFLPK
jgi:Tol biopolymer transport system component